MCICGDVFVCRNMLVKLLDYVLLLVNPKLMLFFANFKPLLFFPTKYLSIITFPLTISIYSPFSDG